MHRIIIVLFVFAISSRAYIFDSPTVFPTSWPPPTSTPTQSSTSSPTTISTTTGREGPCPFNERCYCDNAFQQLFVKCQNVPSYPTFAKTNLDGLFVILEIIGNISYIPANCISALENIRGINFTQFTGEVGVDFALKPLFIDPEAFNGVTDIIEIITFQQFSFATMPTKTLTTLTSLSSLTFDHCDVPYISDYSFSGVTSNSVTFQYTNLQYLEQHAFDGLKVWDTFAITHSTLKNISTAFQKIEVNKLDLSFNNISEILDYAFSPCSNSNCSNPMRNLDLSYNPIQFISNNAFVNLPHLVWLNLQNCKLPTIPTYSLIALPNLVSLFLENNEITFFATNSFYKQHILTTLELDFNPVTQIETGAFNGLTSFTTYSIQGFAQLTNIDLLVTYGMSSLVQLGFADCPNLTDLYLTDYTKIPLSLESISANSGMNITAISSDLQYWLDTANNRRLDISNNNFFNCNPTIQWMTKYIRCSNQIKISNTNCAGSKQPLNSYLQSFQSTCD